MIWHGAEKQVADFGLAKNSSDTHTHVSTRVMGTFGYLAPEYAASGKLTDRSDVFSFGVVLLELVTGRKPIDMTQSAGLESLVEWARPVMARVLEGGQLQYLVDPDLEGNFVEEEMVRVIETAAACVRHSALKRPRMAQVSLHIKQHRILHVNLSSKWFVSLFPFCIILQLFVYREKFSEY